MTYVLMNMPENPNATPETTQPLSHEQLARLQVKDADELWTKVANSDIDRVTDEAQVPRETVIESLKQQARWELYEEFVAPENQSDWLRRGFIVVLLVVLMAVGLRVTEVVSPEAHKALCAAKDLPSGHVLGVGDLKFTRRWFRDTTSFANDESLNGLVLSKPASRGRVIERSMILSPQVVAKSNLAPGEILASDTVEIDWRPFNDKAESNLAALVGKTTKQGIRRGAIVLHENVARSSAWVIVAKPDKGDGLPANHLITSKDVDLSRVPPVEGAYSTVHQVVGRRTLEAIRTGRPVLDENLSKDIPLKGANAHDIAWLNSAGVHRLGDLVSRRPDLAKRRKSNAKVQANAPTEQKLTKWQQQAAAILKGRVFDDPRTDTAPTSTRALKLSASFGDSPTKPYPKPKPKVGRRRSKGN